NKGRIAKEFSIGDQVLIKPFGLRLSGKWKEHGNKLLQRKEGPFEIIKKLNGSTYQIRLPPDWDIHPIINI
ncbi:hypothetical protein CPB86DRAFT_669633, partial [Serendipita vermifera]